MKKIDYVKPVLLELELASVLYGSAASCLDAVSQEQPTCDPELETV